MSKLEVSLALHNSTKLPTFPHELFTWVCVLKHVHYVMSRERKEKFVAVLISTELVLILNQNKKRNISSIKSSGDSSSTRDPRDCTRDSNKWTYPAEFPCEMEICSTPALEFEKVNNNFATPPPSSPALPRIPPRIRACVLLIQLDSKLRQSFRFVTRTCKDFNYFVSTVSATLKNSTATVDEFAILQQDIVVDLWRFARGVIRESHQQP